MANIKLGDLCKEIDASYKEMMTYLREHGCDVKSAGSVFPVLSLYISSNVFP